jgi:hypothetical protein
MIEGNLVILVSKPKQALYFVCTLGKHPMVEAASTSVAVTVAHPLFPRTPIAIASQMGPLRATYGQPTPSKKKKKLTALPKI